MARAKDEPNNLVAEWFGYRMYPTVAESTEALRDQQARRCPFLSTATGVTTKCVKAAKSAGICTISSTSNGPRQDWLVCPYRALEPRVVADAARRMFGIEASHQIVMRPATTLDRPEVRSELLDVIRSGGAAFVYMQDKLGGEVSISATKRSPELSFDVTIVELAAEMSTPSVGRYAVLEIQTMDFHGSYSHVVKDLDDALRLHEESFHRMVGSNIGWLSKKIEGPNIANVFKRTLYQILLKFRLAGHGACAGATLAIPAAVWDSWQRHLGAPPLVRNDDGTYRLGAAEAEAPRGRAWIYVFDIDAASKISPSPIEITKIIEADADAIAQYAFKVAPEAMLAEGGAGSFVLDNIRARLAAWWPELAPRRKR